MGDKIDYIPSSPRKLWIAGATLLAIINMSIFGTIYLVDWLAGPTEEELAAIKAAEALAKKEAIYAKLEPLVFTSKINHISSIGEAVAICEARLHEAVKDRKSWEVNMVTSRFVSSIDLYKIFMDFQTSAASDKPQQSSDVECEVNAATKVIDSWKILPKF